MDRGTWQAIVQGVTKNQTQLKQLSMHRGQIKGADMISGKKHKIMGTGHQHLVSMLPGQAHRELG